MYFFLFIFDFLLPLSHSVYFSLFFALSVCIELNAKEYLCQDKAKKFLGQQ